MKAPIEEALEECERLIQEARRARSTTSPKKNEYGRGLAEAAKSIRAILKEPTT